MIFVELRVLLFYPSRSRCMLVCPLQWKALYTACPRVSFKLNGPWNWSTFIRV